MKALALILPALIPSWRFFDTIGPSPRIEYALLSSPDDPPATWLPFRPQPQRVPLTAMLARLFWNARWNEMLFLVSCAERLMDRPTTHSEDEILWRIAADLARTSPEGALPPWLSFRLLFLTREGETIVTEERYRAAPRRHVDLTAP